MKYETCTDYWLDRETMRLRGEFEKMYQEIDDPWGCTKASCSLNNRIFLEMLFFDRTYPRILDIGCGLGGTTYQYLIRNSGGSVTGYDVSETAISKARSAFPEAQFFTRDILRDGIPEKYDLIILSEVLWYVLDGLEDVFLKCGGALSRVGVMGVHQYFPYDQRFGKVVIDGVAGFEAFLKNRTNFSIDRKVLCYGGYEGVVLLAVLSQSNKRGDEHARI